MHSYASIPDDVLLKPFLPLMPILWEYYQEFGWSWMKKYLDQCEDACYYFFEDRLNQAIETSQLVFNGAIEEPGKVLSYIINIPPLTIRSDLVQGATKLIAGYSFDVVWVSVDHTQNIFVLLNAHCEDGIPVDWWIVGREDDLLDRRHLKYGWKLKEIPAKFKSFQKTAARIEDVLRDIRNERTPEWGTADYIVAPIWMAYTVELFMQGSNFECMANIWEGFGAKQYRLPDNMFSINPFPTILKAMFLSGKEGFIRKIGQLTTENHLYYQPIEERTFQKFKTNMPESIEILKRKYYDEGLPFPIQTIEATMPNIKNKSGPDDRFKVHYPNSNLVSMKDWGFSYEEARHGAYFNITTDTLPTEKLDRSRVLSLGIGKKTKFL